MEKVDFKKALRALYNPKNTELWEIVDVPEMKFLMVDGEGNPNTAASYSEAIEALYAVSYTLKFMSKRELGKDYVVSALEGLWYADDMSIFVKKKKDAYRWTMMIMQPEWIDDEMIASAIAEVKDSKNPAALSKLYVRVYAEGKSAQLLHIGSYDDEAPKLLYLHDTYMPEHGYTFNGHHHEIYLSDSRKVAPEKPKTILRQPIA